MTALPPGGMFNRPLVNVPVDVLYTRRKLLEKIMQNVANRKIQNSIQATGDRMAATPEQFGKNLAQRISQMGKKANTNPADAHGSSFVPLMGGAISGAVKPHPSRGTLTNVLGEGLAGLKGGTIGSLLGGGAGALTDLATKFKGRGVPTLLGTLLGGSLGTHVGSQLHRESIPLNARALAELTNKQSAIKDAGLGNIGQSVGKAVDSAVAHMGNTARSLGEGVSQYVSDVTGNTLRKRLAALKDFRALRHADRAELAAAKKNFQNVLVNSQRYVPKNLANAFNVSSANVTHPENGLPYKLFKVPGVARALDRVEEAVDYNRLGRADYRAGLRGFTPGLRQRVADTQNATVGTAGLAGILGVGGGIGRAVANAQNAAAAEKSASIPEGLVAAVPGAMSGGMTGLGVGALYGLLSGAIQAREGKKLRGALHGALRGAGGGGLIGAGIGGGLGLGTGLMMPNVLTTDPITQAETAVSIARRPISHAAKMMLGATAGGIGGGILGNKARKKLIGDKPEGEDEDEGLETEDKTEISPALKTASFLSDAAKATASGFQSRARLLSELMDQASGLQRRGNLKLIPNTPRVLNYSGNYGRGVTAQHVSELGNKMMQQFGHIEDAMEALPTKASIDLATHQRVFGQAKGNEVFNRKQRLQQQAPTPAAPLKPTAATQPSQAIKPQIPRKSVTSDDAAAFM